MKHLYPIVVMVVNNCFWFIFYALYQVPWQGMSRGREQGSQQKKRKSVDFLGMAYFARQRKKKIFRILLIFSIPSFFRVIRFRSRSC